MCSVFGLRIFEKDEDDIYNLYYVEGTYAWAEAFKMTCWKLDMKWLMDYYDSLEWCDSDLFDGEIENKLISEFVEAKGIEVDTYYQFLIKKLERGL